LLRFAANISTLFTEVHLLERPAAAAAAGFIAIEVQFPYAVPAAELAAACTAAGVECVLLNLPAGRLEAGELGLACLPDREAQFADAVGLAIEYARALRCHRVNCLAGNQPAGHIRSICWEVLVANARIAAERLAAAGMQLLVEPLNPVDFPRFLLGRIAGGDELLAAVAHPNLKLQYDVYHRRAAGDDWLGGLAERVATIGHIQFSDYPGRHEPGTGELDMARLFALIDKLPYDGWTGCEYRPSGATRDSFGWRALLSRA
jgi:hydroxypyruvate isomerase